MNKELNVRAVKQKLLNSTIYIVLVVLLLVIIAIEPKRSEERRVGKECM